MYRTRALVYILVTLGPLLIYLPELVGPHPRTLGLLFLLKALGTALNGPGLLVVSALTGYSVARTLLGRLTCWLLTLLLLEPLLRWIERPARKDPQNTGQVTRRALLVSGAGLASATLAAGYGGLYEIRNLKLEHYRLTLPDLPPGLEGLRLVLMADWHCGPVNRPHHLRPAIELANHCKPDLVLLPGDFISVSGSYFAEAAELAAHLHPTVESGVLVSWGNHDYWHGLQPGLQEMPRAGCHVLTNRALVLKRDRTLDDQGKGLWLCGLDDLWAGKPQLADTLMSLPPDQPRLVLSHNPDVAEEQNGPRVDLMVSGHTHGGQVRIPTLGTPVVPSRYGQKYASGLARGPHYPVYVTRGVGTSGIPVRFGVRPEVTLFELSRGPLVTLTPV